jgi:hypothetical protein
MNIVALGARQNLFFNPPDGATAREMLVPNQAGNMESNYLMGLLLGHALRLEKFCAKGTVALCQRMCQRVLQRSISQT